METRQAADQATLKATPNTGPRVVVIGHDRAENTGPIYAALDRAGCQVVGTTEQVGGLDLARIDPEFVVVRGDMVPRGQDVDLVKTLQPGAGVQPWRLVVLLGHNRSDRAGALKLDQVERVVIVPPYDFGFLNPAMKQSAPNVVTAASPSGGPAAQASVPMPQATTPSVKAAAPMLAPTPGSASLPPAVGVNPGLVGGPVKRRVRVAFYGSRGGVGVSTAALKVAQWLAAAGTCVILIDATGRGDLHLLLDLEPDSIRHTLGNLTLWLGQPSEEIVAGYDALVIDGGRQAGSFNARWVELQKPVKDDELRSLAGLPASETSSGPRGFNLGRLLSVRITE